MKKYLISAVLVAMSLSGAAQTKFSVLGDSYSTFKDNVTPWWHAIWYSENTPEQFGNDVNDVNLTWWKLLDNTEEFALDINNSWSGSTVCNTGYDGQDFSYCAFISRIHNLGNPDVILLFGGTNDAWAKVPLGDYRYGGWIEKDFFSFRPAFAYLLSQLKTLYPEARIVNMLNSELYDEFNQSVDEICDHYGVENIHLKDIEKQSAHPSTAGMQSIFNQVYETLKQ